MLGKWSKDLEKEIIEKEINNNIFEFSITDEKPVYSIDTPPPYLNRPIHIGQATTYAIMDVIARYKRMKGYNVLFPLGLDRNGLPIEMEAEKKFNIDIKKTKREEYVNKCRELLKDHSGETQNSFKKIGISFSTYEKNNKLGSVYETDSEQYRKITQTNFIDLYNKGLIYKDKKVVNYCPGCKTTIADSEIEYKEINSNFNTIEFKVKETGEKIYIATTRPELLSSIGMVVYNPEDERYKHLEGKTAITPIFNIEVLIKPHPIAKGEKGTGIVMMCSAGDNSDIRFFREQKIKPKISINEFGEMNERAGIYQGLKVKEAREKIIKDLEEKNLITEKKEINHKVPICERSKHEIEFIEQEEFYLKQLDFIDDLKKLSKNINFTNPKTKKILDDWFDVVSTDWPISRKRYYATEVPLWYCKDCDKTIVGERNKYQRPWIDKPPVESCPNCNSKNIVGDIRVLDTWFDSSNSPLVIHKYGTEFFEKHPIISLRPQGKEIVRTWLYYSLLKGYLTTGDRIFDDVYIHQHILDSKGFKMSKSKGNIINPQKAIDNYGSECFRLWAVSEGNLDQKDFKCSLDSIASEKKSLNKLWNVSKFVMIFKENKDTSYKLTELDKSIRKEVNNLIKLCETSFEDYDFHSAIIKIKQFIWNSFSSHYIELVKKRAYNPENTFSKEEQNGAILTLKYVLKKILYLIYPITPFIVNRILESEFSENIYNIPYPVSEEIETVINFSELEKLNNTVWKYKKENNLSLKDSINLAKIPSQFEIIQKDIKQTHSFNNIEYIKEDSFIFS